MAGSGAHSTPAPAPTRARLTGAEAAHLSPAVVALLRLILDSHPEDCGVRHVLGRMECRAWDAALRVLGVGA